MNEKITIAVICGTNREGRLSINAAKWVAEQGRQRVDTDDVMLADPEDFDLPGDGDAIQDAKYTEVTQKADAFFVVTPEYNHSIPGSLKRLLDSESGNYKHKPVATAGVSDGPWGGVRACEALLPVYHTMWLVAVKPELYFPKVQELFDGQGNLKPAYEARYTKNVHKVFDELIWMAKTLKAGREQLES